MADDVRRQGTASDRARTRPQWPRRGGESLEQRVWRLLRKHPAGMSPKQVTAALELDRLAASTSLRRLVRKGSATAIGTTGDRRYFPTDLRPDDWRGAAAESLANLRNVGQRLTDRAAKTRPRVFRSDCLLAEVWR